MLPSQITDPNALLPGLSAVIPVYNSAESLPALLSALSRTMLDLAVDYEVILVNDGSKDNSWNVIQNLTQLYPVIVGINLMRNYGQQNATLCGIRLARYAIIVTLDDDLQNPPDEIRKLLAKLEEGYDVVYGAPEKVHQNIWRTLASQAIRLILQSVMGNDVGRQVSPFRVFRTSIREAFSNYASPSVSIDVLLTWGATRFAAIPVRHEARQIGISTYTFGKLVSLAVSMLTGFSTLPLRLASMIGFFFTFFGVGVLVYVIGRYVINGGSIAGFPFLASVIAIFSGATLFALGIIGEYLARIFTHSMGQPPYVVFGKSKFNE